MKKESCTMINAEALAILNNSATLKSLKGFELAKTIILNLKKIETELIEPSKIYLESKDNPEEVVQEILQKECTIEFIPIKEEWLPMDITVEQYSLLSNWI